MAISQADVSQALQHAGVNVFNLQVQAVGSTTVVRGQVGSDADKQKVQQALQALDPGVDVQLEAQEGAALSDAQSRSAAASQTYTVKPGDNLRKIAQHFYGDEMQWHKIRDANPDKLRSPDDIQVGMQLTIPA